MRLWTYESKQDTQMDMQQHSITATSRREAAELDGHSVECISLLTLLSGKVCDNLYPVSAVCKLQGCKNKHAQSPGRMSYRVSKPVLALSVSLSIAFCVFFCVVY